MIIEKPSLATVPTNRASSLLWLYTESPETTLDAATWLDTSRELEEIGWDVTLVAEGETGWKRLRGANTYLIKRPEVYLLGQVLFHWEFAKLFFKLSREKHIDVILFHQMSALWLFLLRLAISFQGSSRPRFVMDSRTLHMTHQDRQGLKDRLRKRFYALIDLSVGYWVDGQLAITNRLASVSKINPSKLWGVWPSGVTPDRFMEAGQKRRFPAEGDPVRVIYVGSMNYERNLMGTAQAIVAANEANMHFELILVGNGTEREDLITYAETHPEIKIFPPVPHEEVPSYLAMAHVGILPFPDEEKFQVSSPIKLFEYMASGLSVLATRIVCHTDVIENDAFTYWIEGSTSDDILEALHQVWADRFALENQANASTAYSSQWTWRASAKKLKTALETGLYQSSKPSKLSKGS